MVRYITSRFEITTPVTVSSTSWNGPRSESEVFEHLRNHRIIALRGDNGGGYTSTNLEACLKEKGIRHETSVAKTPEQNGVSERTNRTILESARSMLHSSSYLLNWVLTTAITESTPYFGCYGRKSNVSHLLGPKFHGRSWDNNYVKKQQSCNNNARCNQRVHTKGNFNNRKYRIRNKSFFADVHFCETWRFKLSWSSIVNPM